MTHNIPVRPEHYKILAIIQNGDEDVDLLPGTLGGIDVVFIVKWLNDDEGSPLMTYQVLAQLVTGELMGAIKTEQPVLQA